MSHTDAAALWIDFPVTHIAEIPRGDWVNKLQKRHVKFNASHWLYGDQSEQQMVRGTQTAWGSFLIQQALHTVCIILNMAQTGVSYVRDEPHMGVVHHQPRRFTLENMRCQSRALIVS